MLQWCKLNRRFSLFIVVGLIVVVAVASLAILYENGFLTDSTEPEPETTGIFWKRDIKNFASGLVAADGKVYTIDYGGEISCYDAETGESVWNGSIGGSNCAGLVASGSRVYGGKGGNEVGVVDAATGEFQWSVTGQFSSPNWAPPSNISVVDDRLFVTAYDFAAYNATTGQPLWDYETIKFKQDANVTHPRWLIGWAFEGSRVFANGEISFVNDYTCRLDPDNGTILWSVPRKTLVSGPPVVYHGQVIMRDRSEGQTTVFSLDETSGDILWSYNVDAHVFQPIAYSGLLVFGASDDSFYALHLVNGTLAWKSTVDSQNITGLVNPDNPLEGFPLQIDSENQKIIGCFAVTTQTVINETKVEDEYWGILCSLDLETGNVNWTKHFTGEGDISNKYWIYDYALTENNIYLTTINDFRIFSKTTGNIIESQHFEHNLTSPVAEDGKVFVTADLWLIGYE